METTEEKLIPQNPLILRYYRLMAAFSKSDDERDFYLDKLEGFIVYIDLEKNQEDLDLLYQEVYAHLDRYFLVPKLTFYEIKKIMEGFVNEKVYDIDTKERLLDIIQSRDSRENFLEFIQEHDAELEKWQLYYQERFRIRIIEWLRQFNFEFVFEEDLDLNRELLMKIKRSQFKTTVSKDIQVARNQLKAKAKTYYSNEALNPRPKRGRPPKQVAKVEVEHQLSMDIYDTVPMSMRSFLFTPDVNASSMFTFSSKINEEDLVISPPKEPSFVEMKIPINPLSRIDFNAKDDDEDEDNFSELTPLRAEPTKDKKAKSASKAKVSSAAGTAKATKKKEGSKEKESSAKVVKEKVGPRRLLPKKGSEAAKAKAAAKVSISKKK
ncbi:MAG: hypothetical protein K0S74_1694 [Chlamydiales bacterium]|jgi:hypothetical protein|nr:hypothetical protein [Chlamydiales bacterium]